MGRLHNQIEAVRREIAAVDKDLELLFADYGMLVFRLDTAPTDGRFTQYFQELKKVVGDYEVLQERIAHLSGIEQQLDSASSRIVQLKSMMTQARKQLVLVYSRIGAIAWEESTNNVIAEEVSILLPDKKLDDAIVERLKKRDEALSTMAEEKPWLTSVPLRIEKVLIHRQLEKMERETERVLIGLGKDIAQKSMISRLHSNLINQLEQEYASISHDLSQWEEEMELLKNAISKNRHELVQAGVAGPVAKKIEEANETLKVTSERMRSFACIYGKETFRFEHEWHVHGATVEKVHCQNQIKRHVRKRMQLENTVIALETEIEINEQLLLIGQDEEKIKHLHQMIGQFNRQIVEFEVSIREKREKIANLKANLEDADYSSIDTREQ
ncbi:MAG: hypothetical protein PHU24_04070 [Sphaerochaetaceae bacterium]|jgi:hypothetical protein|nr:hypothetical protein [Sphaerochaetaceae bacterium]NLO60238.1 hypothetical protein [Spirochaetales bacterium]MDD2405617.1 hypothetical protein [Sphaerochaetaceae bacterium]MDD3671820.1 hypothetical protein [Sphaerochaetaceae bacterium]MDD4259983.1 hypothetical protein [Sphaerochaetaceae bacterium]